MATRAGNFDSLILEQSGRIARSRVFLALLVIAALLLYVGGKVNIVRLGYRIEALDREKAELERENRALRIESTSLSSAARIEDIAVKRLGMIRPAKESIVVVSKRAAHAH
jgi:cell division protein FtsL